jgi:hypothetical protein
MELLLMSLQNTAEKAIFLDREPAKGRVDLPGARSSFQNNA